jgi:hypothetical protein
MATLKLCLKIHIFRKGRVRINMPFFEDQKYKQSLKNNLLYAGLNISDDKTKPVEPFNLQSLKSVESIKTATIIARVE